MNIEEMCVLSLAIFLRRKPSSKWNQSGLSFMILDSKIIIARPPIFATFICILTNMKVETMYV